MNYKGYIFDYGGTLDTGGNHWGKVIWHAYEQLGVPVSEAQFREAYVYAECTLGCQPIIRPDYTFRQTLETKLQLQLEYLDSSLISYLSPLTSHLYAQTQAQTVHSRDVLLQLKERYPLVLVSNFYGNIGVVLQEFGLGGIFLSIVESAVVGVRKPNPRIFTLGMEALGLKAEDVAVVGDSVDKDMVPARLAGCHTIWFKGEPWTDEPVDTSVADRVISDLGDLL